MKHPSARCRLNPRSMVFRFSPAVDSPSRPDTHEIQRLRFLPCQQPRTRSASDTHRAHLGPASTTHVQNKPPSGPPPLPHRTAFDACRPGLPSVQPSSVFAVRPASHLARRVRTVPPPLLASDGRRRAPRACARARLALPRVLSMPVPVPVPVRPARGGAPGPARAWRRRGCDGGRAARTRESPRAGVRGRVVRGRAARGARVARRRGRARAGRAARQPGRAADRGRRRRGPRVRRRGRALRRARRRVARGLPRAQGRARRRDVRRRRGRLRRRRRAGGEAARPRVQVPEGLVQGRVGRRRGRVSDGRRGRAGGV